MKHKLQKEVEHYLKKISKHIPKNYPNKNKLLGIIRQNINEFLSEYPESTMDNIIKEFGTPTELAASFIEEMSESDLAKTLQKKQKILVIAGIACFLCIIISIFILKYVYDWYRNDAIIVEETLYVTDETEFPTEWEEKIKNGEGADDWEDTSID